MGTRAQKGSRAVAEPTVPSPPPPRLRYKRVFKPNLANVLVFLALILMSLFLLFIYPNLHSESILFSPLFWILASIMSFSASLVGSYAGLVVSVLLIYVLTCLAVHATQAAYKKNKILLILPILLFMILIGIDQTIVNSTINRPDYRCEVNSDCTLKLVSESDPDFCPDYACVNKEWNLYYGGLPTALAWCGDPQYFCTCEEKRCVTNPAVQPGIFIDKVTPAQSTFYADDPIVVAVDLVGSGDFEGVGGTLSTSCTLVEENASAGRISPDYAIAIRNLTNSKEVITCEFPPYDIIDEPTKEVEVRVESQFETTGVVTITFMDEDTIRQLRREGKDPNDIYDIPLAPVSVFQPGPAWVGLGTVRSNPIGVKAGKEIFTRFSLTLVNQWGGGIIEITDLEIFMDSGISLPPDENRINLEGPTSAGEGREKYTVDKRYLDRLTNASADPIKTFTTLDFRMKVDKDINKDTIITSKEIEAKIKYKYRLSEQRTQINFSYGPEGEG